jgi:hypothetical protein
MNRILSLDETINETIFPALEDTDDSLAIYYLIAAAISYFILLVPSCIRYPIFPLTQT